MSFLFRSESPQDLAALDALLDRELELARLDQLWQEGLELEASWDQATIAWEQVVMSMYEPARSSCS
jgi:hypothetical protein